MTEFPYKFHFTSLIYHLGNCHVFSYQKTLSSVNKYPKTTKVNPYWSPRNFRLRYTISSQHKALQIFQTYFDNTKNIYRQSFLGFVESSYILFPSPSIREFSGWPTFKAEFLRHQAKHPEEKIAACWILRFTLILVIDRYLEYVHFFFCLFCGCAGTWYMNHGWKNLTVYKSCMYTWSLSFIQHLRK